MFHEARLKIKWANHHIHDIETRISTLHDTDTVTVETNQQTGGEILKHDFADATAFDDIALMVGDAIHNLNCALDYVWFKTVERLTPALITKRTKFPVRKSVEELDGWFTNADKNVISPPFFRFIRDKIRPYQGGNHAIWTIHTLDIRDKHRLLIPVLSQGHIEGIKVQDEQGQIHWGYGTGNFQRPPYVISYKRGLHVKQTGKLTARIAIQNGKAGELLHIPETLQGYSFFMEQIITSFGQFLGA